MKNNWAGEVKQYDRIVLCFSGGKDSISCYLHLLDLGVEPGRIELHHHLVDGREGSDLFDWPVTDSYCQTFARAFGSKLFFSWREGGFERELLKLEDKSTGAIWENPDGSLGRAGGKLGKIGTRWRYPQQSGSLRDRWCSGFLKIDTLSYLINNSPRFLVGKTLVITGERAEESAGRAKYPELEPHRTDRRNGKRVKRYVDHWRPVHKWGEQRVWDIMSAYHVRPHPAYELGWGRLSCMACIFINDVLWRTLQDINPENYERHAKLEEAFGTSIHRKEYLRSRVLGAEPLLNLDEDVIDLALSKVYCEDIVTPGWELPAGAFAGHGTGPT